MEPPLRVDQHEAKPQAHGVANHSQEVTPGGLFVALKGCLTDGHLYLAASLDAGARVVVTEQELAPPPGVTVVRVPQARLALAHISAAFYNHPSRELTLVGITGTNGKTTTTWLLESVFRAACWMPGVIGTTGVHLGDEHRPSVFTTPEAPELQALLAEMAARGVRAVADGGLEPRARPAPRLRRGLRRGREISQLSSQVGWDVLTPRHLPEGYQLQSAYYDPNQEVLILTYLVTQPLRGSDDPSLTASKTITLLQALKNDFIPMQVAPKTNVIDIQVNGQPSAYAIGAWDTEFVKDNQDTNNGKLISTWRNDLQLKNLYWQDGKIYLVLVTDDEGISQQELIDVASSVSK